MKEILKTLMNLRRLVPKHVKAGYYWYLLVIAAMKMNQYAVTYSWSLVVNKVVIREQKAWILLFVFICFYILDNVVLYTLRIGLMSTVQNKLAHFIETLRFNREQERLFRGDEILNKEHAKEMRNVDEGYRQMRSKILIEEKFISIFVTSITYGYALLTAPLLLLLIPLQIAPSILLAKKIGGRWKIFNDTTDQDLRRMRDVGIRPRSAAGMHESYMYESVSMLNALYLELNGAFYKKLTAYKQRESRMRIFFIATATIFHVIAYIVIIRGGLRGDYPIGTMGLLSIAMVNIRSSLREASDIIDDLYQFKTQIDAFVKYLKKRSIDDSKASMEIADNKGTTLSVENVNFWYPVEKRVEIKYSDLTINTPGIIGINAKNGAGKTTLLHLITGDYPSKEGCIKFCNQDISQFSLSSYHRYLATLMQGDSILSSITIKELIIQGQKYDNDTFWRVVETVGLTEKIQNLTLKEDTLCGSEYEHGTGFSGGQNQRLLFARLLYKLATSPVRLVLLDEPTAFFDANMRKLFFKILREFLPENSITILVTHSSAELKKCDRILKLK